MWDYSFSISKKKLTTTNLLGDTDAALIEDIELNYMESSKEKRNNTLSQMRLRSVFKMRISILNTATTEQMGYDIVSFFVYTKFTN